jgi:NAD(P)-dependent dehydrogenase (short-subunit alcohol dehydrogenase family)
MPGAERERAAVVTGGTGQLGRWVVKLLLEGGWQVHVPWIERAEADELSDFLGALGTASRLAEVDITSADEVERFFASIGKGSGRLDALCNIAGGFAAAPLEDTDPATWEHMLKLNATSAFLCSRAAVPLMRAAGGGRIVNVASLPAVERGAAGMSAYASSKAAVLNFTYSLARELRSDSITVNAVAPEILDTPDNRASMPKADPAKWVHPREAARVVAFLASPDAAVVTGSVLMLAKG